MASFRYRTKEQLIADTPSRRDGISWYEERVLRRTMCEFTVKVMDALHMLVVPKVVAQTLAQRFYMARSFQRNDRFIIATACIFLASKSEENHKSLRDVILASFDVRNEGDQELRERIRKDKNLYDDMKENLLLAERCLLYMTGFRFSRTPHELLLEELQDLNLWSESEKDPQETHRRQFVSQVSWNFCNDSTRTTLCLQYPPLAIAHACLFLAIKLVNYSAATVAKAQAWVEQRGTPPAALRDIILQLLECFDHNNELEALASVGPSVAGQHARWPSA